MLFIGKAQLRQLIFVLEEDDDADIVGGDIIKDDADANVAICGSITEDDDSDIVVDGVILEEKGRRCC